MTAWYTLRIATSDDPQVEPEIPRSASRLLAPFASIFLRCVEKSRYLSSHTLVAMRRVYQAVIIPQMLWGLSAWYCPAARSMPRGDLDKLTNELIKIQKRAATSTVCCSRNLIGRRYSSVSSAAPAVPRNAPLIRIGPQWACPQTAKETRKPTQRRLGGWAPTEAIAQKKPFRVLNEAWDWCLPRCQHKSLLFLPFFSQK
jgi:hypothetical protein